ncbi:hypothetical protein ACWT_7400 [Actinoplanes sp. SE50]|uniref:hypothetical protein n=1 Tax=unclassified Actinoplanes TaxID=2626549 RepID=UPI00023EE038|nr:MULTISPECIES: hypothetical protein [unclassified Actinoplanes]AEV88410.1 hypothetical protein ACPL_7530 [Actinoplanes sp. SE50/110]ATO86815.1 hypothetical protein ACWT_7400 [Actinoplanes sp. SE50]SLM04233.1 integral membrane protein [Actinoplanes sp. SE50/110]
MRMPTFSRTATTDTDETARVPVRPRRGDDEPTTQAVTKPVPATTVTAPTAAERKPITVGRPVTPVSPAAPATPVAPVRRARGSMMATLGLIVSVAGMALVLSGPLAGYGVGVAGLGLLLSLIGLNATRRQHVAGKTDALLGLLISLGAIVLGVLALNGQLSWLGTDTQPPARLREWLDAQFANRF